MLVAKITYTVTPCPSCGATLPGVGTVAENGTMQFDGLIWCDNCDYSVTGRGKTDFFAAANTAAKHQDKIKRYRGE